jgi:hypothetical protein
MSTKEIRARALKLPWRSRLALIEEIVRSIKNEATTAAEMAWARQAEARIREYRICETRTRRKQPIVARSRQRVHKRVGR